MTPPHVRDVSSLPNKLYRVCSFGSNRLIPISRRLVNLCCEDMIDLRRYAHNFKKVKPEENSDLNGIRTAVLYQLSSQTDWELVTLSYKVIGFKWTTLYSFSGHECDPRHIGMLAYLHNLSSATSVLPKHNDVQL